MSAISDHFPQFLILPKEITQLPKKHNHFKRNTRNFDKVSLIADVINTDWPSVCAIDKNDPNYSFDMFDVTIINIIDKYCPLKKVTKKE